MYHLKCKYKCLSLEVSIKAEGRQTGKRRKTKQNFFWTRDFPQFPSEVPELSPECLIPNWKENGLTAQPKGMTNGNVNEYIAFPKQILCIICYGSSSQFCLLSSQCAYFQEYSYFVKALFVEAVIPALHELSWEFVFAEHSNLLAILAFFNGFNHFIKAALITFILSVPQGGKGVQFQN